MAYCVLAYGHSLGISLCLLVSNGIIVVIGIDIHIDWYCAHSVVMVDLGVYGAISSDVI